MKLNWKLAPLIVLLSQAQACKAKDWAQPESTDPLQLSGKTGRHLTLEVTNIAPARSKSNEHRICGLALAGDEAFHEESAQKKIVCSTGINANQTATIRIENVPYPAYVTVFHDENLNGVLDFATFDILVAKKTGPIEGVARFTDPAERTPYSKPVWAEVGENSEKLEMRYEKSPFWKFVSEQMWQYLYNMYLVKARQVNHPGKPPNPYCTRLEDCL
ncbi:MAG: hypothetical protein RIR26_367 [Pseudomonadota bacterium]|jgi:hypothetical protein